MLKYYKRTLNHIRRVQDRGLLLMEELGLSSAERDAFLKNLLKHDASKFNRNQKFAYRAFFHPDVEKNVIITEEFEKAWKRHYTTENHHPIGFKNGLLTSKLVAYEIACDLQAMADEFEEGSCRGYYESKWKEENKKYLRDSYEWQELTRHIEKAIVVFEKE